METNSNPLFSDEEIKHYLKDAFKVFCKLMMMSVYGEMKEHNIKHLQDYIVFLFLQYCLEKKNKEKEMAGKFSKN